MDKKKVLLLLDDSSFSKQILPHVCRFFSPGEAEFTLLRVAPWPKGTVHRPVRIITTNWMFPVDLTMREYDPLYDADWPSHPIYASQEAERVQGMIKDALEETAHDLEEAGYDTRVAVAFGEPIEEIKEFVQHEGIDLVAMATHGWSDLRRLVLSSLTEQVVRELSVPVFLIRPVVSKEHMHVDTNTRRDVVSVS